MQRRTKQAAFTIVELVIVISVIAILAAITVVAYNGIQANARDSVRKQDLANIAKAFGVYESKNPPMDIGSGCGSGGNGDGWFNYQGGTYPISVSQCLINAGVMSKEIIDPSGAKSGSTSYMKYTCDLGGDGVYETFLYAHLETQPSSSTATDGTCNASADSSYDMNYYVQAI